MPFPPVLRPSARRVTGTPCTVVRTWDRSRSTWPAGAMYTSLARVISLGAPSSISCSRVRSWRMRPPASVGAERCTEYPIFSSPTYRPDHDSCSPAVLASSENANGTVGSR
jgi:hypothetical protein